MTARMAIGWPSRALAGLIFAWASLAAAFSQEPAEKPAAPTVAPTAREFYRVFVPEGRIRDLAKGLLPLKREEFERRIAAWIAAASPVNQPAPLIDDATYDARFDGNGALRGRFRWQVQLPGTEPRWFALGGESLPISEPPIWDDAQKSPAILGADPAGRSMLLVARSGAVSGGWSLRAERSPEGDFLFRLRPHPAVRHRWNLELDAPWQLSSESRGVVVTPSSDKGKPWQAEFRSAGDVVLRLSRKSNSAAPALAPWRQVSRYAIDRAGIDLTAELRLVNGGPWPQWLEIETDPGLQPVTARLGEVNLTFESLTSTPTAKRFAIQIPSELPATALQEPLEITATAPPVNDRAWRLPRLRCTNLAWQEEQVRLVVRAPHLLEQLQVQDGQQIGVQSLAASAGEEQQVQLFQKNAVVTAIVVPQKSRLAVDSSLRVTIGGAGIEASETVDLQAVEGTIWELQARFSEAWVIDHAESVPAGALESWQLLPADPTGQPMRLRLARAIAKGQPLRLRFRAHRTRPAEGTSLPSDTWRLSQWPESEGRSSVALAALPPYRLEVSGDANLRRLDPIAWPSTDGETSPPRAGSLLFARDAGAEGLRIELSRDLPQFSADLELRLSLAGDRLSESYQFLITPGSAPLERVLIRFSRADDRNLPIWSLGDEGSPSPIGRRLTEEESRQAGFEGGEVWLVQLPRPMSVPFVVRAQRSAPWNGRAMPALVQLPQAARQSGRVVVASLSGEPLDWEASAAARRLEALPVPSPAAGQTSTLRGVYRYDPAVDFSVAMQTGLALIRGDGASAGSAWSWSTRLTSRYQSPETEHAAEYWLESDGRPQCRFTLPAQAKLRRIEVGRNGATGVEAGAANRWAVPLPVDQRFILLRIEFTTPSTDLEVDGQIAPPFPQLDVPELDRRWMVWLPPGLALLGAPQPSAAERGRLNLVSPWLSAWGIDRSTPWRPMESSGWSALSPWPAENDAELPARQFLFALAAGTTPPTAGDPLRRPNWSAWLRGAVQRVRGESETGAWKFLLDSPSLAESGLRPDGPVDLPPVGPEWELAARPLARRGLALISSPQMLLLTSADRCARWRSMLVPTAWPGVWKVAPGSLAAWSSQVSPEAGFVQLALWSLEPRPAAFPWAGVERNADSEMPLGWTLYDLGDAGFAGQSFGVIRPDFYRSLSWLAAFILLSLAFAWPARFAAGLPIVIGVVAAAGYTAPAPWADVILAGCTGLFAGAIARWLWVAAQPESVEEPAGEASTKSISQPLASASVPGATALLLLLSLTLTTVGGHAADPPGGGRILHPVMVPVDDKNQPTGSVVYIPPALYQELLQFGDTQRRAEAPSWLLVSADYELTLQEDSFRAIEPARFVATYVLETKEAATRVRLPLARQGLHLLPSGAKLDGKPADLVWEGGALHLEVVVPEAGRHRLELECRPTVVAAAPQTLHVGIPRVPATQLVIKRPGTHLPVDVPTARGAAESQSDLVRVDIGAADALDIHWGNQAKESAPPVLVVDQFQWLRMRRGGVILETRLRAAAGQGWPAKVRVRAPAGWRPLAEATAPVAGGVRWQAAGSGVWQVDLSAGERGGQVTLAMTLSDTAGIGDFSIPWIEIAGARPARAWQALSHEQELAWEQLEAPAPQPIAAADFVSQWGGGVAPPAVAWQVAAERDLAGRIRARLQPSRTQTLAQEIDYSVARSETLVALRISLETTGGAAFQQQIPLAKGVQLASVELREPDGLRAVKWSQDQSGALWIRSAQPLAGKYQLDLRGRLPAIPIGVKAVPKILGQTDPPPILRIYRQDDSQCVVASSVDWISDVASNVLSPLPGRLVARLVPAPGKKNPTPPQLQVDSNRPRISGQMVVRLHKLEEAWTADVDCRVNIAQGIADQLRFDFPNEFATPSEIRPAIPFDWHAIPATTRARLTLTPAMPLSGDVSWHFTLPWKPAAGPLAAPDFAPRDGAEIERYLMLPAGYELHSPASATGRWEAAELPMPLRQADDRSTRALRLVGSPSGATIARRAAQSGPPAVRLQDIRLAWSEGETCVVSSWEIEPAALRECIVELPAEAGLVRASVGGVPVAPRPLSAGKWRLPLGPRYLPQRVEVVYRSKNAGSSEESPMRKFAAPILAITDLDGTRLREVSVDRTLWTIRGPRSAGRGEPESGDQAISPFRQSLERLQSAAAAMERPAESGTTYTSSDLAAWYLPWVRHLIGNQASLVRQAQIEGVPLEQRARMDQLEREQIAIAARLDATGARNQAIVDAHRFPDIASLWEATRERGAPPIRLSVRGVAKEVVVDYPELAPARFEPGLLAGLTALAMGLLGAVAVQTRFAGQWLARWPAATGVLLGLAIWWFGGPIGWLGWLLALLAVAGSLRVIWVAERRAG